MHTLYAVDDGIANGNLNWADVFFLIGTVLALLAALAAWPTATADHPGNAVARWLHVLLCLAVGCVAFGFFLL